MKCRISKLPSTADMERVHEENEKMLRTWDSYLSSMIYVSKGIGENRAATKIAKIRSQLIGARERARREQKSGKLLLRNTSSSNICRLKRLNKNITKKARSRK